MWDGDLEIESLSTLLGRAVAAYDDASAIEAALYEHPDIAEAIVIGVPDAYRGQSAKAYVALKKGAAPFTLVALTEFLADRLGRHEMPRALEFRAALPRSPASKLLARALIDELAAQGNA
jgi:long-chain acyl-CoA synthetase